jgi:hypothetical protein
MTAKEFEDVYDAMVERTRDLLVIKAREYAGQKPNVERLHNFKRAEKELGGRRTAAQAAMGFALKHWIKLLDLSDRLADGVPVTKAEVDEAAGDAFTFLPLAVGCLYDEIKQAGIVDHP